MCFLRPSRQVLVFRLRRDGLSQSERAEKCSSRQRELSPTSPDTVQMGEPAAAL